MATIRSFPFLRHLTGHSTSYVELIRGGEVRRSGVGAAFWFRPLSAVLSEVPVDDRELPVMFHGRTSDFFDVTVQGTVTYRIVDPALAARRLDFGIHPGTGAWSAQPLEQLAGLLVETARQLTVQLLTRHTLTEAMAAGVQVTREAVTAGLADEGRLADTGVAVIAVRILSIDPEPEVERALQTPAREEVQQEADRATFERRALAVEREAAIGENELANRIGLARREEELVSQRGRNDRRRAELAAETATVTLRSETENTRERDRVVAEGKELVGRAEAAAEAARLAAWSDVPERVVLGLALRALAENMPDLRSLVVAPDTLGQVLSTLADRTPAGTIDARADARAEG